VRPRRRHARLERGEPEAHLHEAGKYRADLSVTDSAGTPTPTTSRSKFVRSGARAGGRRGRPARLPRPRPRARPRLWRPPASAGARGTAEVAERRPRARPSDGLDAFAHVLTVRSCRGPLATRGRAAGAAPRPPQVPRAPAAYGGTPRPTRRAWTEDRERRRPAARARAPRVVIASRAEGPDHVADGGDAVGAAPASHLFGDPHGGRAGRRRWRCRTCTALAPQQRNSRASSPVMMPPTPTSGMRTARASSWTMRRATGLMAGPERPPVPLARRARRVATSTAVARSVLMAVSASAALGLGGPSDARDVAHVGRELDPERRAHARAHGTHDRGQGPAGRSRGCSPLGTVRARGVQLEGDTRARRPAARRTRRTPRGYRPRSWRPPAPRPRAAPGGGRRGRPHADVLEADGV